MDVYQKKLKNLRQYLTGSYNTEHIRLYKKKYIMIRFGSVWRCAVRFCRAG